MNGLDTRVCRPSSLDRDASALTQEPGD